MMVRLVLYLLTVLKVDSSKSVLMILGIHCVLITLKRLMLMLSVIAWDSKVNNASYCGDSLICSILRLCYVFWIPTI